MAPLLKNPPYSYKQYELPFWPEMNLFQLEFSFFSMFINFCMISSWITRKQSWAGFSSIQTKIFLDSWIVIALAKVLMDLAKTGLSIFVFQKHSVM